MNPVASLLTIDGIALNVDAPSRKRAFEELAHLFEKNAGIPHREAFDALNARERLGCTVFGAASRFRTAAFRVSTRSSLPS